MSTANWGDTFWLALPGHRQGGKRMQSLDCDGSHQRMAGTRRSCQVVDLLRGNPEPRGREFWRPVGGTLHN